MSILGAAQLFAALLPLVTVPYVVRVLGPTEYGKLAFGLAVVGFAGLIANPGVVTFALREVARGVKPVPELMGQVTAIRLATSFVAVVATLAFGVASSRPADVLILLVLLSLTFPLAALDLGWVLQGRERMGWVSIGSVVGQTVYVGAIFLFVHTGASIARIALALLLSGVASLLVVIPVVRDYGFPTFTGALQGLRVVVGESFPLGLASFMSMIYVRADTVMLEFMRGTTEVGYYAGSYKLMEALLMAQAVVGRAILPRVSRLAVTDLAATRATITRYASTLLFLGMPAVAGSVLIAPEIVTLILGPGFTQSITPFRVLSLVVLAGGFAGLYAGAVLVPLGRNRAYVLAVGAGAAINILLNVPLIPRYGAVAAAATTVASQTIVATLGAWFARDKLRISYRRLWWRPTVSTGLMVLVLLIARSLIDVTFILVPLGVVTYLAAWMVITGSAVSGVLRIALSVDETRE